jgi:hypothetical protein
MELLQALERPFPRYVTYRPSQVKRHFYDLKDAVLHPSEDIGAQCEMRTRREVKTVLAIAKSLKPMLWPASCEPRLFVIGKQARVPLKEFLKPSGRRGLFFCNRFPAAGYRMRNACGSTRDPEKKEPT